MFEDEIRDLFISGHKLGQAILQRYDRLKKRCSVQVVREFHLFYQKLQTFLTGNTVRLDKWCYESNQQMFEVVQYQQDAAIIKKRYQCCDETLNGDFA